MDILTDLKIDKRGSLITKEQFYGSEILLGQCYSIVLNIVDGAINNGLDLKGIEVAYGYVGDPSIKMCRHCFFVLNKSTIIDPILASEISENYSYHIFKILSFKEYHELKNKFYEKNDKLLAPTLEELLQDKETRYCDYAIENNVHIDEWSYEEYLKKYDTENKVVSIH